ncbi:hypothetical protein KP509_05G078300 [Ceratopteris richardii]|uniref:Tyrosinase copper-binding domain-containing protein n=1 Tax=Ceratopteris richardii TaxID=49495 RepID=A0A8T2UVT9_CERRI|nr:hypothetical protein KP509_05G078300 [Ceratopteris richardii]
MRKCTTGVSVAMNFLLIMLLAAGLQMSASRASPVGVPNLNQCELATDTSIIGPPTTLQLNCCLPIPSGSVVDFSFQTYQSAVKRVRMPAHKATADYIAKYTRAYEIMRSLPDHDPRSLSVQSKLHCAFCNGAYKQLGSNSAVVQVHFSWLFLPWHRWYLYFHERILASLLGDPTFSLVFWNWDDQRDGGNTMPAMFLNKGSSLYDQSRNAKHLPPNIVKLVPGSNGATSDIVKQNLNALYQDIVTSTTAETFMGGAFRDGTNVSSSSLATAPLGGSMENGVHNSMHFWTGDPTQPLYQDMGTFLTAARDPIFYAHHSNVDRLWERWLNGMPGGQRALPSDPDFLNAEFYFYDEAGRIVKVFLRDALDNNKLGVSYPDVPADDLWTHFSPTRITTGSAVLAARANGVPEVGPAPDNGVITLHSAHPAIVKRFKNSKERTEVLVVQGLQVIRDTFVSLIVFVNLPDANSTSPTSSAEYVGTFNVIPVPGKPLYADVKFEIGDNLRRVGIENESEVVVTLVVRGTQTITIQGLHIGYA